MLNRADGLVATAEETLREQQQAVDNTIAAGLTVDQATTEALAKAKGGLVEARDQAADIRAKYA